MSKSKITMLTAAVALAISGTAFADGTVGKPGASELYTFANEVAGGSAATTDNPFATVAGAVTMKIAAPDILIGRKDTSGQITVEATLSGAVIDEALVAGDISVMGGGAPTVSSAAGSNTFQFTVTPPTGGFTAGDLFTIAAGELKLRKATGVQTLGGDVKISFTVKDTTTGTTLSSAPSTSILGSVAGSKTKVNAGDTVTIDVVAGDRKSFKISGGGASATNATLGTVVVSQADVDTTSGTTEVANASGTKATGNVSTVAPIGTFIYDAGDDKIKLTLSVPSSNGFTGTGKGFYADVATCATTYTADADTVAFVKDTTDATKYTATVPVTAASGATYNICAINNGTDRMDAQTIGLTAQIDMADALTIDPAAVSNTEFAKLVFNGPVVNVNFFNPSSNSLQESYLRITNTSSADGLVQIDGTCDNGVASTTPVSFTLGKAKSVLLTSSDIEKGNTTKGLSNGLGACTTGKYRLVLTARFASMEVQNFLRNRQSAGDVNTNVNNDDDANN